jgi:hypothetical protein
MDNFSYLEKPISECSDQELINWYIAFKNGADPNDPYDLKCYDQFQAELVNRSLEFKDKVEYIDSVI